ncbi:hypothetical protein [Burkholderia cepacia]|nr:hypothetical protein [Burkholderia cepacia]
MSDERWMLALKVAAAVGVIALGALFWHAFHGEHAEVEAARSILRGMQ